MSHQKNSLRSSGESVNSPMKEDSLADHLTDTQRSFLRRHLGLDGPAEAGRAAGHDADELARRTASELRAMEPDLREALAHFPSLEPELKAGIAASRQAAESGDAAAARAALESLRAAVAGARDAMRLVGSGDGAVPVMRLGKARIEWAQARQSALTAIPGLKQAVKETFLDTQEVQTQVDAGLAVLDRAIARLTDDLDRELDALLDPKNAARRGNMAQDARRTAEQFLSLVRTDPVISTIDGNAVTPDLVVVAPMAARLTALIDVLDQVGSDPAPA